MERHDTSPPHVLLPWGRYFTIALAAFTALVLLMATVYAATSALNKKADKTQVEKLRESQSTVKEDIAVIKNDVNQIKRWLRPRGDR